MWLRFIVGGIALALTDCAGGMLNEATEHLGPSVGSLEEKQVLQNIGRFVDNPWAIPGHVELFNGQVQITNMVGVNAKLPYSKVRTATSATTTLGNEYDLTPAQTQDQESYNLLPVTDSDDLRRLRALYQYAVCPDPIRFAQQWAIADQYVYQPPPRPPSNNRTTAPAPGSPQNPPQSTNATKVKGLLQGYLSTHDLKTLEAELLKLTGKPLNQGEENVLKDTLEKLEGPKPSLNLDQATAAVLHLLGIQEILAAPGGGKPSAPGAKTDSTKTNSGADTIAFEQRKGALILSELGLGQRRWLYWRNGFGQISGYCRGGPIELPPFPEQLTRLGLYGGHEFFTDDPRKFSDLVLFVLGGIPNTTGSHILDSGAGVGTGPAVGPAAGIPNPKSRTQAAFSIGGQTGIIFSKP
jgi:hypothetical protein